MSDHDLLHAILRNDLVTFVERCHAHLNPGDDWHPNWHIECLAWHLQRVRSGEERRLILNLPPRSLKSTIASVAFVAFALGHNPRLRITVVSYADPFAHKLARDFRSIIESEWYRAVFSSAHFTKSTESEVVTSWHGGRYTVSIGGAFTGRGADIIIVDDPLKAQEAMSESARASVIDWFLSTAYSRLNDQSKSAFVIVMQRLHEHDLVGAVLEREPWTHIVIPAIAPEAARFQIGPNTYYDRPEGELLTPSRDSHESLKRLKSSIGSAAFDSQYQQCPLPATGNLFKREWLRYSDRPPLLHDRVMIVQSWDTAGSVKGSADYSVCTTWHVTRNGYHLVDVYRERVAFPDLVRHAMALATQHSPNSILIEDANSGAALLQVLRQETRLSVIPIKPKLEKLVRADQASPTFQTNRVVLPTSAMWRDEFEHELLAFPNGRHDDQVDSAVQFVNWMNENPALRHRFDFELLSNPSPNFWRM